MVVFVFGVRVMFVFCVRVRVRVRVLCLCSCSLKLYNSKNTRERRGYDIGVGEDIFFSIEYSIVLCER